MKEYPPSNISLLPPLSTEETEKANATISCEDVTDITLFGVVGGKLAPYKIRISRDYLRIISARYGGVIGVFDDKKLPPLISDVANLIGQSPLTDLTDAS